LTEALKESTTSAASDGSRAFRRSPRSVARELKKLRHFIESPDSDTLAVRIAQIIEDSLRWATEDMRGMCDRVTDAVSMAGLIRAEVERGSINIEVQ